MACLQINILGEPQFLDSEGIPIGVASRKSVALIASLALAPGRTMPREDLVARLWGDRFDQQGRQSLRQALYSLKRTLGEDCGDILSIDGETIALDAGQVGCDAWDFEKLAASEDEASLRSAVALYRGRLLSGIAIRDEMFEEWLTGERQHYRDLYWRALYGLAKCQKRRRAWDDALDCCRMLLDINPLREKTHRLIMRIHAQAGDRTSALQQYQQCEDLLRRELNLEPDMTTLRLYEDIKASKLDEDEEDEPALHPALGVEVRSSDGRYFASSRPSVAVLNFENLGGDRDKDYLAQGITSDIATALSYWRWFPVIGQTSASAFRNTAASLTDIARELEARYIVTGTARFAGERIRITVQLLDAATGHHLWAQRYDDKIEDLFEVQDEITERIVSAIEPQLLRAEHNRAFMKRTDDLTAWDYVMRADWCKSELDSKRNTEAINHLQDAISIDPLLSIAWSHLSNCYWHEGIFGWASDPATAYAEADNAARKALALDDSDWLAHTMLGLCDMWNRKDHDTSLQRLSRALELNPSASIAHHAMACSLEFAGRPEDAIAHLMTVMKLDPQYRNNTGLLADFALTYMLLEQFEDSATYGRKSISLKSDYTRAHHRLAASLAHLGRIDEAKDVLDDARRLDNDLSLEQVRSSYPFANPAHLDILLSGLRKAGLPE